MKESGKAPDGNRSRPGSARSTHFALEEKIMRDAGYADYSPHKEDHESLLDQLADIIHSVEIGGEFAEDELSSRLNHWFSEHFRTHDAKLHRRL
jgi:hemerythrin